MRISEVTQQIINELKQGERSAYEILIAINQTRSPGRVDVLALYRALAQLEQQGSIRNAGDREVPGSPHEYQRYYRLTETRQPTAQTKAEPDQPLKQEQALVDTTPQPVNVHDSAHYQYDVFISVSSEDRVWVNTYFKINMQDHFLIFLNEHFSNNEDKSRHFETMSKTSHTTLIILSPSWKSEWEECVIKSLSKENLEIDNCRFKPVLHKTCQEPDILDGLVKIDLASYIPDENDQIIRCNNWISKIIESNKESRMVNYPTFEKGTLIIGRYKIENTLTSKKSTIYLASDTLLNNTVLIKKIKTSSNSSEEINNETKILLLLKDSPIRVPRVFNILNEYNCYVMNYIKGENLEEKLSKDKISTRNALQYTYEICKIIKHLHELSIIHQDIKADNIILDEDKHIWLVDFGRARLLKYKDNDQSLKFRTDIVDLAKILYQLITGNNNMPTDIDSSLNNTLYIPKVIKELIISVKHIEIAQRPDAKTFLDRLETILKTTLHAPDGSLIDTLSTLAQWIKDHWQPGQQDVVVKWLDGNMSAEIAEKWKNQALAENIQQRWADLTDNKEPAIDAVLALIDPDNFGALPQKLKCSLKKPDNEQEHDVGELQAGQEADLQLEVDQPASISHYTLVFSNPGERYVKSRVANWPFWIKILTEHTAIELAPRAATRVEIPITLHGARFHNWNIPEEYIDLHFDDPLHAEPRVARIPVLARAEHATTPKRWWNIWLALLGLLLVVAMGLYWFT